MVKSLKFIGKTMVFEDLEGWVWTVRISKKHQKWDQNPSEIQWKINTKNMLEKREPKYENSSKKWSKKGTKIHQKSLQKSMRKKRRKKKVENFRTWHGEMRVVPKPNHFKRHPSEWSAKKTNEESWLKGEYRVKCKKWSAKGKWKKASAGKCRKASADREPTTHPNTLGGQRPRADRLRAFRQAMFLYLSVCGFVGLFVCGVATK